MLKSGLLQFRIVGNPSPEAWKRVHRYASWMRRIHVGHREVIEEDAIRQFRLNSPTGGWFPALRTLGWTVSAHNLRYIDLLFSPYLEEVWITTPPSWSRSKFPRDVLPVLASTISTLPASALRSLRLGPSLGADPGDTHWVYFENSLSSIVLRCGPSLLHLASPVPLSDVAVDHVIRLPHLRTWRVGGPPPNYSASSPLLDFPTLTCLTLWEGATRGWLSLFKRLEERVSVAQGTTPLYRVKESLTSLSVDVPSTTPVIDISITSPIQMFRNLVILDVVVACDRDKCAFKLNNDNVTNLAIALPQLVRLHLGFPCQENTCDTTVACLLPISVYSLKLEILKIHFNTTNIVDDLKNVLVDPRFQELRSLPRGALWHLGVHGMPLTLDESDFEIVVDGMVNIFPSLRCCAGYGDTWDKFNKEIKRFREHEHS